MKLLKGSVVALVTPFVDDKEQSVNKEKLAAYLAPMPVWW